MSLDDNALITLANLKVYLNIDSNNTDYDSALQQIINSVSTLMETEMDRKLVYATYTDEYLDGSGMQELYLPQWPVVSVTSIEEDETELTEGEDEDFTVYEGYLRKVYGTWARGRRNIKTTFIAGYWVSSEEDDADEMPKDIQLACMKQCGIEWKRAKSEDWDLTSKTFPDGSVARNITNLHPQVEKICQKYARMIQ
jgi:hypothetical protein